ncbi:MAG: DUF262 domain-containing protein [Chromatiales bacterium]|nr:DUF262 domain-containing protein [Chromatiales bacterium]
MQQLTNIDTIFKEKKSSAFPTTNGAMLGRHASITDFWEDINSLETGKHHYTGVLSLEETQEKNGLPGTEDSWIIENKGYTPFFVVDGQQRLTTCIIFIQAILEEALEIPENTLSNKEDYELCDTKISDIKKEFIFIQRSNSLLRSYIFGYEKDNPSYEFLKTKIFKEIIDQQSVSGNPLYPESGKCQEVFSRQSSCFWKRIAAQSWKDAVQKSNPTPAF